jgi:RND family efflux transporter MFP subunit
VAAVIGFIVVSGGSAAAAPDVLDCLIEPRLVVKVGSPVQGIIAEVLVDRGDRVKRDDVLARLDSGVEKAQVEVARARASNEFAVKQKEARQEFLKRKRERAETLQRGSYLAQATYDEAETEANMAELDTRETELGLRLAQLELRRAEEELARRTIRSPLDGVVVERTLSAGEYAYDQAKVMTLAQVNPLNIEVFAPLAYFPRVAPNMKAEVMPEAPIGGRYTAVVKVVDTVFDAGSGTFGIRLELPNPDAKLPAGLRCKVRFLED